MPWIFFPACRRNGVWYLVSYSPCMPLLHNDSLLRHGGPPPKTTQICSTARFLEGRPLFTAIHERTSGIRCQ